MLLKTVRAGLDDPAKLITHRFQLQDVASAYDTFSRAAETHALKVIIEVAVGRVASVPRHAGGCTQRRGRIFRSLCDPSRSRQ